MKIDFAFKRSAVAWHQLLAGARRLAGAIRDDITACARSAPAAPVPDHLQDRDITQPGARPQIFVSYATDESLKGSHRFCGGEKLLNNLVLLLRRHGYEAWMVSVDGKHADWLAEHAPFLSIADFRSRLAESREFRCVTSWITAKAFLDECGDFYFWDQELGASSRSHFPALSRAMASGRIIRTAGVNRAVQAWHRAVFETPALLLRQLIDEAHWNPAPGRRAQNRVGYFDEGDHGAEFVRRIRELTSAAGLELEFLQLAGVEREIIGQMQTCSVFLALNVGKSSLWGEGGPMTPQEAMACGTVPVCFDINGPWEVIQQHYNGVVVGEITPEAMGAEVVALFQKPRLLETMSQRCVEMTESSHTMEARWPAVARFLDLPVGSVHP